MWSGNGISSPAGGVGFTSTFLILIAAGTNIGIMIIGRRRILDGRFCGFGSCEAGDVDGWWGFVVIDHFGCGG